MSTDRITETIAAHRPYGMDCKCGEPINSDADWSRHFQAALQAARIAVIELPEPTGGPDKHGHVRFSDGSEVGTVTTDTGSGVVWSDGWEWSANQARDVAGVWLAAADAAEVSDA